MDPIYRIGITGGMGVGKTTVCHIFQCLNIPVFDADSAAKNLYETDDEIRNELIHLFGKNVYHGKKLNKELVAAHIFNNEKLRNQLNGLVHPKVIELSKNWIQQQQAPYVVKEAALLLESGSYKELDAVILVTAPLPWRIEQLKKRNPNWSIHEIQQRIKAQWDDEKRKPYCQFLIQNTANNFLIPQVLSIHHQILNRHA